MRKDRMNILLINKNEIYFTLKYNSTRLNMTSKANKSYSLLSNTKNGEDMVFTQHPSPFVYDFLFNFIAL